MTFHFGSSVIKSLESEGAQIHKPGGGVLFIDLSFSPLI